MQTQELKKSHC